MNLHFQAKFPRIFAAVLALVFLSKLICPPAAAQTVRQKFHLHALDEASHLTPVGLPPATKRLNLAVSLPLRNRAALDELLRQIYDPASANYHRYLTPEQFAEQFGPTESDYQKVIAFARANNLTVTTQHPNRAVLDVSGRVADIEKLFHVTLRTYRHPKEARTFFAPDTEPSIDLAVPILNVSGLDDFALPHPASLIKNTAEITPNGTGSVGGAFAGNDFRAAYVPGTSLTGAGQTVALLQFDGYFTNDIAAYEGQNGLPSVSLTNVPVDGGVGTPGGGVVEVSLDIEMVISMAPGISNVIVYEAPNPSPWVDLLNKIATDNLAKQISCSWAGGPPDAGSEQAFVQMAAQGQSFFCASGDSEALTGSIPFPTESTNITLVGGTTLTTTGPGGAYVSETVWNWGLDNGNYVGSSGGVSVTYPLPTYQRGISMAANQGSLTMRNIPDVALTGDNIYVIYNNGSAGIFGGTSCAAPLWAAFTALANQQAAAASLPTVGFLNPAIYEIGRESIYATNFNDITVGNNFWPSSPTNFSAVPGYDLCTGWGTPTGTNLINALVNPDSFVIVPAGGFNSSGTFGGPFSATNQIFSVSNAGPASLDWSVINTNAWLDVSPGGGTLAPGGGDSAAVSLDSSATNLPVGTYDGYVWLTNLTDGIGHSRLFTLQILEPLAVSPANGFAVIEPYGGPVNPTNEIFSVSNLGTISLNWSVISTSSWLNVSSAGGILAPGASASVAVSLDSSATNLPGGTYSGRISLTNLTTGIAHDRLFSLQVTDPLVVSPAKGFSASGPPGGPFNPTNQIFSLTNLGGASVNWTFTNLPAWLNATSGTVPPFGSSTATVCLNSAATSLPAGVYVANPSFVEVTGGFSKTLQFSLSALLVQNGGFETGDFTAWTLNGDAGTYNFVTNGLDISALAPHSGTYLAALGESGFLSHLSQTVPTSAGHAYLLSLWLDSPNLRHQTLTPNEFSVIWDGSTLFDQTNIGKIGWTNLQFLVIATNSGSVLQFGTRDDKYYLGLDDISVTPVSLPTFQLTTPTNNTFNFSWNAVTGLVYQLQYKTNLNQASWVNLGNPATATNTLLKITNSTLTDPQRFYRLQVLPVLP